MTSRDTRGLAMQGSRVETPENREQCALFLVVESAGDGLGLGRRALE